MASSRQMPSNNALLTAAMSGIIGIPLECNADPNCQARKISLFDYHDKTYSYGYVGCGAESVSRSVPSSLVNTIELRIKGHTGRTMAIRINRGATIEDLKRMIQDQDGTPFDEQRVVFAGKQLEDLAKLSYYGIHDGSTMHIVTGIGGGGLNILDPESMHPRYDYDFTHINDQNSNFTRGGLKYTRPCGWKRFAIKVSKNFGDSVWLGHNDSPGEWPVSYHATGFNHSKTIATDGYDLTKGKQFAFDHGVYSTPDIKVAEKYAVKFKYQNEEYLVVLQNRVNPETLVKISADQTDVGEYWINPSDKDVRPYGICIRKV